MQDNTDDTLPKYRIPEDLTLDVLDAYVTGVLRKYEAGNLKQEDLLNHGDALEEFLWKKYGDMRTLTFPMWKINAKLRMCSYVIDWMNVSNEFGYLITPKNVAILIDFLNTPHTHDVEKKRKSELREYFKHQINSK